jgi:hypothetical protein
MVDAMTISIARECLETIDRIQRGQFLDHTELHALESDRSMLHAQLETMIGHAIRKSKMPEFARRLVAND